MIADEHLARADTLGIAPRKGLNIVHVCLRPEPSERSYGGGDILLHHPRNRRTRGDLPALYFCLAVKEDIAVADTRLRLL